MKHRFPILMLLALLLATLAACGPAATPSPAPAASPSPATDTDPSPAASPSPDTGASPSPATDASPAASPQTGERPDDEIGVVEIGPNDPITIGYALVVAGPDAALGEDSRRGAELAITDRGELLGHSIEFVGEDTGCSPEGGQAAATRLASNQQIVAIIGTSCSSEARVLAPVIDQAGMVLVSPSNTAPDLTDPENHVEGYLRTAHNDNVQGAVGAEFAYNSLGLRRAATIHDGSLYAEQLANVFANRFRELGGEVVAQEAVGPQDTDMRPVLTRIASTQPEIIYYPIFIQAGGFVTSQAKEVSGLEEVKLMGADGIFSPDFITAAGEAAQGMYLSSPDFSAFGGGYQEFLQKYQQEYGTNTTAAFHAHAYDAANIIMDAIERVAVQGEDGTLYIGRQALRDALYETENFQGLTGNLTCDENGDCADPQIAVYEVVNTDPAQWSPGADENSNPRKIYPE